MKTLNFQPDARLHPITTSLAQERQQSFLQRLPKELAKLMTDSVQVPRWLLNIVLPVVLTAIFAGITILGGFLWKLNEAVTRMEERQVSNIADSERRIKTVEVELKLADEHNRGIERLQSEMRGELNALYRIAEAKK